MTSMRALLFATLFFASCILPSEPNSKVRVERDWGFAGAATEQSAEQLAKIVEQVLPELRRFGGFHERPLRIHASEEMGNERFEGITIEPRFGPAWVAVRTDREDIQNTVAHELVHFYFDAVLSRFPHLTQEGLAEYLAARIHPVPERRRRLLVFVAASYLERFTIEVRGAKGKQNLPYLVQPVPSVEELFELDWYDSLRANPRVSETVYGLGLLMAERIGWEATLALVARADRERLDQIPGAWIREAAGLEPPTTPKLRAAVLKALDINGNDGEGTFRITL